MKPYNRLTGVERVITKSAIGVMVFGIVAENILGWTFPSEELQYQSHLPMLKREENIFGHMDIYECQIYPLEVKASRKTVFRATDLPKYWVEQLMSYMSLQGAKIGWLVLFNVFSTVIMAFRMVLTAKDILGWLVTMAERAELVRKSAKERNASAVPINPLEYNWCHYKAGCSARAECKDKWKRIEAEKKRLRAEKKRKKSPLA